MIIVEFIRALFCRRRDDAEFVCNLYGDAINVHGGKRSLWQCRRCARIFARGDLQP